MDIFKLVLIAIITTTACIILKQTRPEFALFVGIAGMILIFIMSLEQVGKIIELIKELSNSAGMPSTFINVILKIIGISYITEFAANTCKDAGETAMASKIQFAGKCTILVFGMTIIANFAETLVKII